MSRKLASVVWITRVLQCLSCWEMVVAEYRDGFTGWPIRCVHCKRKTVYSRLNPSEYMDDLEWPATNEEQQDLD